MKLRERAFITNWKECSAAEVEHVERIGIVGNVRFEERTRRTWLRVWYWSSFKFSDFGAWSQDVYYARHGLSGLERRFVRAQKLGRALGII